MQSKDSDKVVDLAARIADGTGVDWPSDASAGSDVEQRDVIESLKDIATVAALHRAPTGEPPGGPAAGQEWMGLMLVERIGAGRFGEVYRAWDPRLERHVALKLLDAPPVIDDASARAIDEARALARVRHQNVLTVYGAERLENQIGIWTELIEGHTLEVWLSEHGPLSVAETTAIGIDVCRALAAVHAAGLVHRDVKAQNVMREVGGRIVLMDFGAVHDPAAVSTPTGKVAGTPLYMAPELFAGASPTMASDLYGVAVLLCRLVAGNYPVTGRTLDEVKAAHAAGQRRSLRELRPDLPAPLISAIERGLAADPAARYASANEFGDVLAHVAAGRARSTTRAGALTIAASLCVVIASAALIFSTGRSVTDASDMPQVVCRNCVGNVPMLSGDGSQAVRKDPETGDLKIRTFAPVRDRRLFVKATSWDSPDYADVPRLSPDGTQIVFRWVSGRGRGTRAELRIMPTGPRAVSRVLLESADEPFVVTPLGWRPDNTAVLVELHRDNDWQLAWVGVTDHRITPLWTFPNSPTSPIANPRVSPNGKYIVYLAKVPAGTAPGETHLHLLNHDGGQPIQLVTTAAANAEPFWTADSSRVLFTSDIAGSFDLWAISIADLPTIRAPVLIKKDAGRMRPLASLADGRLYYEPVLPPVAEVFVVEARAAQSSSSTNSFVGAHPTFSPDGRLLAFYRTQMPADQRVLVVRDVESGRERVYSYPQLRQHPPMWTSDSAAVLVAADRQDSETPSKRIWWVCRVDLATDEVHDVVAGRSASVERSSMFTLSPDDKTLYFGSRDPSDRTGRWSRIVAVDVATAREHLVVALPGGVDAWPAAGELGIAVSPDSRSLALFMNGPVDRPGRLALVEADGRNYREIASPIPVRAAIWNVSWTRDGRLWFAQSVDDPTRGKGWHVMTLFPTGGRPVEASPFILGVGSVTFHPSPDGSKVAISPEPGMTRLDARPSDPSHDLWMVNLRALSKH